MDYNLVDTQDGSYTIFSNHYNTAYHSRFGALTESKHVFIHKGLEYYLNVFPTKTSLKILEVGFGTGFNCALAALYLENAQCNATIEYTGLEKFLLPQSVHTSFNCTAPMEMQAILHQITTSEWGIATAVGSHMNLQKINADFFAFESALRFDIVFFDAFAPSTQPEMWNLESTQKLYRLLEDQGLLVTFCAQGQFKRNLKQAGFRVESLPGPPQKREMTRASKL